MKKYISFLIIPLGVIIYIFNSVLLSANTTTFMEQDISKDGWRFDSLVFNQRVHLGSLPFEEGSSVYLSLTYPVSTPPEIDIDRLSRLIIYTFDISAPTSISINNAFDSTRSAFITNARETAQELIEGLGEEEEKLEEEIVAYLYSQVDVQLWNTIGLFNKYVLTTSTSWYWYITGAHGVFDIEYYNIDLRDYHIIKEDELFKIGYEEPLAKLIQDIIAESVDLPDTSEHIIPWDGMYVKPNKNFYFSKKGIVFAYNVGEISCNGAGVIEVTIPYDRVRPLLNDHFLEVVDNIE